MGYTTEKGRKFWHDFDQHFRYEAAKNGFLETYKELGGEAAAADALAASRADGTYPASFADFADARRTPIEHLANSQMGFFESNLTSEEEIIGAFQDFAFGLLESADAEHRSGEEDTRHTMSGGAAADGYRQWNGFAEAAIALGIDPDFWNFLRRANGMAWELHVKSHPADMDQDAYARLPEHETEAIQARWMAMSPEQIAEAFDNYADQTNAWLADKG